MSRDLPDCGYVVVPDAIDGFRSAQGWGSRRTPPQTSMPMPRPMFHPEPDGSVVPGALACGGVWTSGGGGTSTDVFGSCDIDYGRSIF